MRNHRSTLIAPFGATVLLLLSMTPAARAQVTTTSGGDVSMLSQKNVVDHLIVGDSIEVVMAQLAVSRSQNAAVKEFATMLVTDHQSHLTNLNKLAGKKDIGREANAADTSGAHIARALGELQSMSADSNFDRAFISAQIEHHTMAIAALNKMKPAAKDDDLQKDIDKTLPVLQNHLSRANAVLAQLGTKSDTLGAVKAVPIIKKPPVR